MLQRDFYNVSDSTVNDRSVLATLNINAAHHIFEGHFPGHPVVPGVCMMQMLKELLENVIAKETRLLKADYLKFLAIINPTENPVIQAELSYTNEVAGVFIVIAKLHNGGRTFLKFKGQFALRA